jgi:hypothetical protein
VAAVRALAPCVLYFLMSLDRSGTDKVRHTVLKEGFASSLICLCAGVSAAGSGDRLGARALRLCSLRLACSLLVASHSSRHSACSVTRLGVRFQMPRAIRLVEALPASSARQKNLLARSFMLT